MKNKKNIIITLLFLVLLTSVNAFDITMNLENTTVQDTTNIVDIPQTETSIEDETNNSSQKVTVIKNDEDEFLTIENVLSIISLIFCFLLYN